LRTCSDRNWLTVGQHGAGNEHPGSRTESNVGLQVARLQGAELKQEIRKLDKVSSVGNMLMFSMHPDEPGAGRRLFQDIIIMVEYCKASQIVHKQSEGKFHLFILSAFQKDTREFWQRTYWAALASTTGIEMGSKIYMAFLRLFEAFSTTSDNLVELFGLFDHAVMTTARHVYSCLRLEKLSDVKEIDFLIDMFIEAGRD